MNRLILQTLLLLISLPLSSQVLINEFSASNISSIADEDGDHCDWIELYNSSAQEINLLGYFLSDDRNEPGKWTFPGVSLKPGAYAVIFASDKNRADPPLSYRTLIRQGDNWKYLVPSSNIGDSWKGTGFNDSGWSNGPSGFGYGDNDDATVLSNIMSIYIRKEFTISNIDDITELILSIDYDDGFVAYINGQEIARRNLGTAGSIVSYNQAATGREAVMFNGGFPENYTVSNPASILVEGVNILAIEGHNTGTGSTDFSLIPMLTTGLSGAGYTDDIPDYIQLKGRKLHTNFKISSEGESLYFSDPDTIPVDSIPGVELVADVSYGRQPDGTGTFYYFASPTPGSSNISAVFPTLPHGDTVKFSREGGYFFTAFQLSLSSADPADTIYYSLDGSEPGRDDSVYTGPITISANCVVRARSLNIYKLPGVIATNTYFTGSHTLPVVCLSTNPENLWDYYTGIYVLGPNASTTNPFYGANFWQDWEKRAHMEFYDKRGSRQIDQDIGIKIYGAWSRAHPQKSLALFARREYGKGSFDYKFFADKPITKFESVILRNGGNDWDYAIFRDGLVSTIVRDMDIDRLAFQPAIVYLNGEYWGILNIREKINTNYLAGNHFVDPDDINLLEDNAVIVDGNNSSYKQLTDYLNANTLETEQKYIQAASQIDINNFIQYQLTEIYIDNRDWPGNNVKFWKTNEPGSLWRWILFDTDFGFSIYNKTAYEYNTLAYALVPDGPSWPNPPWGTLLLRRLLSNPGFRNNFVNQYADRINTTFASQRVVALVDSIKQIYNPEISQHINRWNLNYSYFLSSINNITGFANNRPAWARQHLQTTLNLGEPLTIKVEVSSTAAGRVIVNSVVPDKYPFTGAYFRNTPVKLTAIPRPGYKFVRWEYGGFISYSRSLDYNMASGGRFRAFFEPAESSDFRIVINEINYNSSPDLDAGDWVELYNAGSSTANLKDWIISDGEPESGFRIPSDLILIPGAFAVICRNTDEFADIYPKVRNITGNINFGLSSSGDDINLYDNEGNLIDFVNYSPNAPWPIDANGTGATIELTDPYRDNNLGQNWRSRHEGGSPGEKNILTGIEDKMKAYQGAMVLSCFPNPFRDFTTIYYEITRPGRYSLQVFDLQGRVLKTISDRICEPGSYTIDWAGDDSAGSSAGKGVYILRISGEGTSQSIRVVSLN